MGRLGAEARAEQELHREVYTDASSPIPWPQYRRQYLNEQKANRALIEALAKRVAAGEMITLLCSSACTRESRCHRSILQELIEGAIPTGATSTQTSRSTDAKHGAQGEH